MQAFTADELSHMEGVVHDMRDYHSRFERHEMSADDFYDLFCSKEDAQCIKRATELIGLSQYTSYITVQLEFTINDRTVFAFIRTGSVLALPRNTKNIRDGAPPDLVNRLVDYVAMQSDITARYSRVTQLVQHLNALCASPSQMRFLWPAVSTLASRIAHPKTKEKLLSKLSRNFRSAVSPRSEEHTSELQSH